MNGRTTIRRETEGLTLPFGKAGVAAIGALGGGLAGLLVPRAMLESLAFQLYLDTIIPAAKAPLGATAQIVAAVLLAIAGAMAGYLVAWIFGVTASAGGFSGLLARLRGELAEDEEDAPPLRAADRHPDAPARRPFSAARDIPEGIGGTTIEGVAQQHYEDEDELLLDLPVADAEAVDAPLVLAEPSVVATLHSAADTGPAIDDAEFEPVEEMIVARGSVVDEGDAMDGFNLSPPTLDDWENGTFAPVADDVEPVIAPAVLAATEADPSPEPIPAEQAAPQPSARATPPPLDLSAARLDELIARLEAGLTRKVAVAAPALAAAQAFDGDVDTLFDERPVAPPTREVEADPAFPHDPALAAALATLRKMNLRSA